MFEELVAWKIRFIKLPSRSAAWKKLLQIEIFFTCAPHNAAETLQSVPIQPVVRLLQNTNHSLRSTVQSFNSGLFKRFKIKTSEDAENFL